jgi:hypothetical protein
MEATATYEKTTKNFVRYNIDEPWMGQIYIPLSEMEGETPEAISISVDWSQKGT